MLDCCAATVRREANRGRLRGTKVGSRWRFPPDDVPPTSTAKTPRRRRTHRLGRLRPQSGGQAPPLRPEQVAALSRCWTGSPTTTAVRRSCRLMKGRPPGPDHQPRREDTDTNTSPPPSETGTAEFYGTGYARAFDIYHRLGWQSMLPLAASTKFPPPTGYTGHDGIDPSYADMTTWGDSDKYRDGNLCAATAARHHRHRRRRLRRQERRRDHR